MLNLTESNLSSRSAGSDANYEYGADFEPGRQRAEVIWVVPDYESSSGRTWLRLTLGLPPVNGRTAGAKVDVYVPHSGAYLRRVVQALAPELLGSANADPTIMRGRFCQVDIEEEPDRNGGTRPRVTSTRSDGEWCGHVWPDAATEAETPAGPMGLADTDIPF